MRYYLASGFENKELVQHVSAIFAQKGLINTYDWTKNERADTFENLQSIGEAEKEGVKTADFLIALLPGGKGTHIEIGIAIGLGKPVYIYNEAPIPEPTLSCTFYHIDGVKIINGTIAEFVEKVMSNLENRV